MANEVIKQSIIRTVTGAVPVELYSPIPYLDESNILQNGAGYCFRYRVVSKDKTRFSQWSSINLILGLEPGDSTGQITSLGGSFLTVVWGPEIKYVSGLPYEIPRNNYDIFVGFDNADPSYNGSSTARQYTFENTGTTNVRVIVQAKSYLHTRLDFLEVYDSGVLSL